MSVSVFHRREWIDTEQRGLVLRVIRGTRITVDPLLRKLSEGATEADILHAYPHLTADDIRAALAYAVDAVSHEEIELTAPPDVHRS